MRLGVGQSAALTWGVLLVPGLFLFAPPNAAPAASKVAVTVDVTIHGHSATAAVPGVITFIPDRIKAGTVVTFKIRNTDTLIHNFQIDGYQTRDMGPRKGEAVIREVLFKTAARYVGSCPDDRSGIAGIFVVT